jgi:hypothetical protein
MRRRGQGLVEFALIFPVVLLMIFVIIELARVLHAWLAIENGARFAIRYAVTNAYDGDNCAGGADATGKCLSDTDEPMARIQSIKEAGLAGSASILRDEALADWSASGYFKVTICGKCMTSSCFENSDPDEWTLDWTAICKLGPDGVLGTADDALNDFAGEEGDQIWVVVDFNHPLITPYLTTWWPMLHLTSRRDGIVETFRTVRYVGMGAFPTAPPLTDTPTLSPTATDTPTITDTPTSTYTPTFSPTPTRTPTKTPTPDCDDIYCYNAQLDDGDDFEFRVRNNNEAYAYLVRSVLTWSPYGDAPPMYWDKFRFKWGDQGTCEYEPSEPPYVYGSPVTWNVSGYPWSCVIKRRQTREWESDFSLRGEPFGGYYRGDLRFEFRDWGFCNVSCDVDAPPQPTNTPRPTSTNAPPPTAGPSPTRTKTRTPRPSRTPTKTATPGPPPTSTQTKTDTPAGPPPTLED